MTRDTWTITQFVCNRGDRTVDHTLSAGIHTGFVLYTFISNTMSSASLTFAIARIRSLDKTIKKMSLEIIRLQVETSRVETIEQFKSVEAAFTVLRAKLETVSKQRSMTMELVRRLSASDANLNYVG